MKSFQNYVLCIETGQLASTAIEALQIEANGQSYTTINQRNILKAKEKSLQCAVYHPKSITFKSNIPQRILARTSWWRS